MLRTSQVEFKTVNSRLLSPAKAKAIQELLFRSVRQDFEEVDSNIDVFLQEARRSRRDPNKGVGGALFRRKQSFARPRAVLATYEGGLVGYLPVADNASSKDAGFKGYAQRSAQLHATRLPGGERLGPLPWRWLGICGLSGSARQEIRSLEPEQVNVADMLVAMALNGGDPTQRVSAYPWETEGVLKATLSGAGFEHIEGDDFKQQPFGPGASEYDLEHWTALSAEGASASIAKKQGARILLERAGVVLQ